MKRAVPVFFAIIGLILGTIQIAPAQNPAIDVEKTTNGVDADSPPGPVIASTGTVTWRIDVTNVGDVPLTNVEVYDTQIGWLGSFGSLEPGASGWFTIVKNPSGIIGQYENVATATADYTGGIVSDSDSSHFFGADTLISIDIKLGSSPNSINPWSKGLIPVAILTTPEFDAANVDPSSVTFGPDGAEIAHTDGHIEDVDNDGDIDLLLHFRTQDTGIVCGDTTASLTGETFTGEVIGGFDSINTVPCN